MTGKFLTQQITSTQIFFIQKLFGTKHILNPLTKFLLIPINFFTCKFFSFYSKIIFKPNKIFQPQKLFWPNKISWSEKFSDPKVFLTQNIFLTNKITKKMYNKIFDKNYFFTKIFFYQMKFFNLKNFSVFWPELIWPKRVLNKYKVLIDAYVKNSKVYKFEKFKKVF